MTKSAAKDYIRNNLPTETVDGTEMVVFDHPTDGATTCPACGHVHVAGGLREHVPVDLLAEMHHTTMENSHADAIKAAPVSDVAQYVVDSGKSLDAGHGRYFGQVNGVKWP